jgi:hypothetical protein
MLHRYPIGHLYCRCCGGTAVPRQHQLSVYSTVLGHLTSSGPNSPIRKCLNTVTITNEAPRAMGVDDTDCGQLHLDQLHPMPHPNAQAIPLITPSPISHLVDRIAFSSSTEIADTPGCLLSSDSVWDTTQVALMQNNI